MLERFEFYGLRVAVESESRRFLDQVVRDFRYFHRGGEATSGAPDLTVVGIAAAPEWKGLPSIPAAFLTPRNVCFLNGNTTYIDYFGRGLGIYDRAARRYAITAADDDLLHEIAYLFLLSAVGEHLDARGLHRVHALGLAYRGRGILLLLPSGGGKSTMALQLLRRDGFSLLAEDTPLVDARGRLHPFPLRLGVRPDAVTDVPPEFEHTMQRMEFDPKKLIDVACFEDRLSGDVEPEFVLVGERNLGEVSAIEPISYAGALRALVKYSIVGLGVYQGMEFVLERGLGELGGKLGVAASRTRSALKLLSRASSRRFVLGRDVGRNTETLLAFLEREMGPADRAR